MTTIDFVMGMYQGGGPRNVYTFSKYLNAYKYESEVLQFINPRFFRFVGSLSKGVETYGSKVKVPGIVASYSNILYDLVSKIPSVIALPFVSSSYITRALTLLKFGAPDIYVATDWGSFFPTLLASNKKKAEMLYFVQTDESNFKKETVYKKMAKKTYEIQQVRITQSLWVKTMLDEAYGGANFYIGFGIAPIFFSSKHEKNSKALFTIARNSFDKGFDIFVNAVNDLWSKRKDFSVVIAGEREILETSRINFPFRYIGWIRDDVILSEIYSRSIFVNTGRFEALPMPALEAMASGAPVVLNDITGIKEFAVPFENCLVSNMSDPYSFSNNISTLLDSPELQSSLGQRAKITANKYKWDTVIEKFLNVIHKEFSL